VCSLAVRAVFCNPLHGPLNNCHHHHHHTDTFVLMDDVLLEPTHPDCTAAVPLFGVYDGHGGGAAAQHCARRLHHFVAQRLQSVLRSGVVAAGERAARDCVKTVAGAEGAVAVDHPRRRECPLDTAAVEGALREAFIETDAELQGSGVLDNNSGSTAVVALLTPASIWLAWAGDSRAVLVKGGQAVAATSDHRPAQREDEKARIEQAGGMLLNNGGLRLMGMLATTRAIGDHDLQPYGLTPVPEVMHIGRTSEDEFLVGLLGGLAGYAIFRVASKTCWAGG